MSYSYKIVDSAPAAQSALNELWSNSTVFVDCEGVDMGNMNHGTITIIAVLGKQGNTVYLFDMLAGFGALSSYAGRSLKALLESPNVRKVFWDTRNDVRFLQAKYGVSVQGVFDLQENYSPSRLSLKDAVSRELGISRPSVDWRFFQRTAIRPIPSDVLDYCVPDLNYIKQIYNKYFG